MKNKKIPLRMCIVSREMLPKNQLVRIVKTIDGNYEIDFTGKVNGRGAYIKNSIETLNACLKTKALNRAFKENVTQQTYNKLIEDYEKYYICEKPESN